MRFEKRFCADSAKVGIFHRLITAAKTRNVHTYFNILFQLGWVLCPIDIDDGDYPRLMEKWLGTKSKEDRYSRSRLSIFTMKETGMVQLRATSDVANKRKFVSEK
jgi:hypothetical protein